jgi:hypothetical protein
MVALALGAAPASAPRTVPKRVAAAAPVDSRAAAARAQQLVPRLGNDSFDVREQASAALKELGLAAKPALLAGLQSQDAEIRARCRRLLPQIMDEDFSNRLSALISNKHKQAQPDFPAWRQFVAMVGDDAYTRRLFFEMQRSERELMQAIESGPELTREMLEYRSLEFQSQRSLVYRPGYGQLPIGSAAALFFAAAQPGVKTSEQLAVNLQVLGSHPSVQMAMRSGPQVEPMQRILNAWVSVATGPVTSYQAFMLALRYRLPAALEPALATLKADGVPATSRRGALLVVGMFGKREHAPLVAPLLQDSTPCGTVSLQRRPMEVEVRDTALAVLATLLDIDPGQFGLGRLRDNAWSHFKLDMLGFRSAQDREAGFARWHAWREGHASHSQEISAVH